MLLRKEGKKKKKNKREGLLKKGERREEKKTLEGSYERKSSLAFLFFGPRIFLVNFEPPFFSHNKQKNHLDI